MNTLEQLVELQKTGEEFEVNGVDELIFFFNKDGLFCGKRNYLEYESSYPINHIILNGIKKKPWVPKEGEECFYIQADGEIDIDYASRLDISFGNYFRTEELAKEAAEKVKTVLKECKHE